MNQLISRIRHNFVLSFALIVALLALFGCESPSPTPAPPAWPKSKVLATQADHPSKILVDRDFVYYVTGGTVASQQEGTNNIKRIALENGEGSVLVKGADRIPDAVLALDAQFVYWSDSSNILRVPKAGGQSEILVANVPKPAELLVDDEQLYWLIWRDENSPPQPVMVAPKQGGQAKPLTPPETVANGLNLDGDTVYWTTPIGIRKAPKTGGVATFFYANPTPDQLMVNLTQDADNFYFAQMTPQGQMVLMQLAKQGGVPLQLAPSIDSTYDFVADNADVYYFAKEKGGASFDALRLQKVSTHGGRPVSLDKGEAGWIKYLTADQTQLYFTDIDQVYALPK